MDTVRIVDLEVIAHHGVLPAEQELGQKFLVSVDVRLDAREACEHDAIEGTVDYAALCRTVDAAMRASTFKLIERAAEAVATAVLEGYPCVQSVRVEVKKPWAPIGLPLSYASIVIERARA